MMHYSNSCASLGGSCSRQAKEGTSQQISRLYHLCLWAKGEGIQAVVAWSLILLEFLEHILDVRSSYWLLNIVMIHKYGSGSIEQSIIIPIPLSILS